MDKDRIADDASGVVPGSFDRMRKGGGILSADRSHGAGGEGHG